LVDFREPLARALLGGIAIKFCRSSGSAPPQWAISFMSGQRPFPQDPSDVAIDRVVLINDFSEVRGGAATLVVLLLQALRKMKIPVTLITGDEGSDLKHLRDGVEVVSLNKQSLLNRPAGKALAEGIYNPSARALLSDWISRNDTANTVYHLHNWSHILSPSIFAALRPVWRRTALHAHDYFLACPNGAFANYQTGLACPLKPMSAACLATNCDRRSYLHKMWRVLRHASRQLLWNSGNRPMDILLIHEDMKEPFLRSGFDSSHLITVRNPSNAFSNDRVAAESNREFVFIGRVVEEKGIDDFLSAVESAAVPARVIGDGNKLSELKHQYPNVIFDGWRSRSEIAQLIQSARMVVVSSRYPEPFGLVIVEALASGLPVIVPRSALLSREVSAKGIGLSYDPHHAGELAEFLKSTSADDALVERMSRQAYALRDVLSLAPEEWSSRILAHYRSLLHPSIPVGDEL
jgi:glycosyltransferase involved in cell wall biosynthesis